MRRPEWKGGQGLVGLGGCGEDLNSASEGRVLPRDALSREAWQADTADVPRTDSGGTGHTGSPVRTLSLFTRARWWGSPRATGHISCVSQEIEGGGTGPGIQHPLPSCGTPAVFSGFPLTLSGPWFLRLQDRK